MAPPPTIPHNTSPNPPTLDNTRGEDAVVGTVIVMVFMTIIVAMRLWGRYRYKTPGRASAPSYGESRFWILLSDITIVISYALAVSLTAINIVAVKWGEGIHIGELSFDEIHMVLEMFFVYQVLYKLLSGLAKVATLFLLMAISTPQMKGFRLFCKIFAAYILAYCIACSLATVFQCGTSFASNWNKTLPQNQCFYLPPFWYSHAAINISATAVMIVLPWWLFSSIVYQRKHVVATVMSVLAAAETALGIVRLYGLYTSAHSSADLTYGIITGILVSQLEVDFACIAACVPTVLKMTEEFWVKFCVGVLGITSMSWQESRGQSYGRGGAPSDAQHSNRVQLSDLRSGDHGAKKHPYSVMDKSMNESSNDSTEHIVKKGQAMTPSGGIKVQKEYFVSVEETSGDLSRSSQEDVEQTEGGIAIAK